ncbi:MAG: CRTAC1 family protein [Isosphaeraceae bacterium]|nr:CRTAC1 family protein [Isosphaeraceae bacterium]
MYPERHFPTNLGSGVALLDYDGDGWLDVYFANTRNLPLDATTTARGNRLYRNRADGTFEDVTDRAGTGFRGFNHGVTVGDVDNDGFPDLFLTNFGPNVLYLNNGDGSFRDATAGSGLEGPPWSTGAAFLDYDGDGALDLYVSCYGEWSINGEHPFCGDKARNIPVYCSPYSITPARHHLYRNKGDGTFEETTESAGVGRSDGRGLGVIAADVNRDGRADLYVANDGCPNFLFLNRGGGKFEDVSEPSGAATNEAGDVQGSMGVDVEDVDGDGWPELFVTNFRGQYNTLYRNHGGANFQDVSAAAGIVADSLLWVGWGCSLGDFDNDGHPDMLVVNGEVDDNLKEFGQDSPFAEPTVVWGNAGDRRFRVVPDPGTYFAVNHVGRGAAFGDLDNDGRLDVIVAQFDGPPAVLVNDAPPRSWIRLELLGSDSNRSAVGATVEVRAGGTVIHRQVKGGGSYLSANDHRLLVGLGSAAHVERVDVLWPSGRRSTLTDLATGHSFQIREPERDRVEVPR